MDESEEGSKEGSIDGSDAEQMDESEEGSEEGSIVDEMNYEEDGGI